MLLVCYIGIICLVSSSSNAAPVFTRWPFLASDSVHVVSPAASDASKAASALQMPALNHPSPHAIADGKLGSTNALPKKSPNHPNSISSEDPTRKDPAPGSQENSLHNPAEPQVNTQTPFPSQKATDQNPKSFKPEPPDKPQRFRFSSTFKDYLKKEKSSPSFWRRLKEMKENSMTVIHLLKALLKQLKLYTPREYAPEQSSAEAAGNARKAANFKNPSPTFTSTGVMNDAKVAEAKSAEANAIKPDTMETDSHHQTERNNVPSSSWWDLNPLSLVNSVVDGIKPRLQRTPTTSSAAESAGHLSLGEINKSSPSTVTPPAPPEFSSSPADAPSVVDQVGGPQPAKTDIKTSEIQPDSEGARSKNSALSSNVKGEVTRAQLEKLIHGILMPMVSKYLTPEKTSKIVDSSLRTRGNFMKWAASWLPQSYSHEVITEKIAPSVVRAFSSWATRKILSLSSQNMFEILEHHALELLTAIEKASSHPTTPP